MISDRAAQWLQQRYSGSSSTQGFVCLSKDSQDDHLTYLFLCHRTGQKHYWAARARDGEFVEVSPLNDAAAAIADSAGQSSEGALAAASRLSAADRTKFLLIAEKIFP